MITFERIVKISSKGQITLPKVIRNTLHSSCVRVIVEDKQVRIEPVHELAGSLKEFARDDIILGQERELAWEVAMKEKHATD